MIEYENSDGICVLRLNAPPVNTITLALLEELTAAIARANADAAASGIVITGARAHFSAGADVNLFKRIASADEAIEISRVFQDAFGVLEDSAKPVAAAVAGRMMGSAVELALACHFRVCAHGTKFSMPEVNLGINPGAGGTQRLPRLIGPEAAMKMLLTGRAIDAAEARRLGLVDAVCDGEQLVDEAAGLVRTADSHVKTSCRTDKIGDDAALEPARKLVAAGRDELIAPAVILNAVETGLTESVQAGLRAEQRGFADCMATPATRNKIYLFFAVRETAKVPQLADAKPAAISTAAVVGMGSMGTGIAHALIIAGVPVTVLEADESALQRGVGRIRRSVEKRVSQGKLSPERAEGMLSLVATTTRWADLADADLIIEAVFEDADAKRAVIGQIEQACREDAVIATNTSTISLDVLSESMVHPDRLIGMHFFNPAHRMPLVEIVRSSATAPGAIATGMKFAKNIRKTPVLVRNREGFVVNRIFIPYLKEAFGLLADGASGEAIDAAMVDFGFAMGPLTLIDMAGLDILVHTDAVMARAFPRHAELSAIATQLVDRGQTGQKAGGGVYRYDKGDYTPHHSETAEAIVAEVRRAESIEPRDVDADEITRRLVLRMVCEAFHVLEEGIAQRESDVDAAMVLGTGFPSFRGGPLRYAHDVGLDNVLADLDKLASTFGERFSPCRLLREMKGMQ